MSRSSRWSYPLLLLAAVAFALPLLWMLFGSFKPPEQPESEFWPRALHVENYGESISSLDYSRLLANSILLAMLNVMGSVVSCTLVAYGFAKVRWPGRDVVFFVLVATMLLPFHVTMLPRFQLFAALGMYDTYWPLVLPSWLACEAFYVFLLRQFFLTIPEELSEAARLDGASEWTVLTRVVLPLSWPALTTVAIFQFFASWNEFAGPLLYLNDPAKFPLAYALQQFVSAYRTQFGPLMAASVMFTAPVVVLFFLAQKTFVRGIATTGLKG
jgi:multiple sugar transport system permease protein